VSEFPRWSEREAAEATGAADKLPRLQALTEAARAVLARLQHEVVIAENRLNASEAAQLLETNQQLVLSMLDAMSTTDGTTLAGVAPVPQEEVPSARAELDGLTALPNRALLREHLVYAIGNAKRRGMLAALIFLGIDDFGQSGVHGHAADDESCDDEWLKLVAQCLTSCVRVADTVSRDSGAEFLILLPEVAHRADVVQITNKLIAALDAPQLRREQAVRLTASLGISIYPDDGEDADTLIDLAGASMRRARMSSPGSFAFHGKIPEVAHDLSAALDAASAAEVLDIEHVQLHAQLREANERLVLAALGAQELQARAERAQQRQTELLAVVAHELRNPLTPIRTAAALLGKVAGRDPLLSKLQAILERQVAHMSRLVGDLLDVSRVSTGKFRLERQRVEMAVIIEAAVDACRPVMEKRQQRFSMHMPDRSLEVHGDPVRLAQIITNLLDNASKYTHDGGDIGFSVMVADNAIVMTVSDNGIGITPNSLLSVFEPFVQDEHAVGFNGVGLGIGLAVVRELVEAHGGHVAASSAGNGLGSLFVVTLPLTGRLPLQS